MLKKLGDDPFGNDEAVAAAVSAANPHDNSGDMPAFTVASARALFAGVRLVLK